VEEIEGKAHDIHPRILKRLWAAQEEEAGNHKGRGFLEKPRPSRRKSSQRMLSASIVASVPGREEQQNDADWNRQNNQSDCNPRRK
jgi:hypothetical protein